MREKIFLGNGLWVLFEKDIVFLKTQEEPTCI